MTEVTRRPLIRPAFLRWSTVVVAILIPFVAHAAWDYRETRELDRRLTAIVSKGEPLRRPYVDPKGDARMSQRYYRAAAVLASGLDDLSPTSSGDEWKAGQTRSWPDDLIAKLRPVVERYQDALGYADRAASLPFEGFVGSYSYLASDLSSVARLCGIRAVVRASDGDGEGAIESLVTQARLAKPIGSTYFRYRYLLLPDLQFVLERTRPTKASLRRLSQALEDSDVGDAGLKQDLMMLRAQAIGSPDNNWADMIRRPLLSHRMNEGLRTFDLLLAAAEGPWPEQGERVNAAAPPLRIPFLNGTGKWPDLVESFVTSAISSLSIYRTAVAAIAIEMYRRDHGEQVPPALDALVPDYFPKVPLDPYTGRPLSFETDASGYAVYSVGADRRDDAGDVVARRVEGRFSYETEGPDIGVRVRYR